MWLGQAGVRVMPLTCTLTLSPIRPRSSAMPVSGPLRTTLDPATWLSRLAVSAVLACCAGVGSRVVALVVKPGERVALTVTSGKALAESAACAARGTNSEDSAIARTVGTWGGEKEDRIVTKCDEKGKPRNLLRAVGRSMRQNVAFVGAGAQGFSRLIRVN